MKNFRLSPVAALGLFGAGLAAPSLTSQDLAQQQDLAARLDRAEATIATLEAGHAKLEEEVTKLREFTKAGAGRADALLSSLTRSEGLGFTAGINFQSREELLAGFRAYLNDTKEGLRSLAGDENKKTGGGRPAGR